MAEKKDALYRYQVTVKEVYTVEVYASDPEEAKQLALEAEDPDYEAQDVIDIQGGDEIQEEEGT